MFLPSSVFTYNFRCLSYLITVILISYVPYTLAGIGSSSLAPNDNTNPATADPTGNITCVGEYDLALPLDAGFSPIYPNGIPMQQLCAKTQFGGGQPGHHIGGWCQYGRYHSEVVFDLSVSAQINPVIANPRVMLACSYRCFCNYGLTTNAIQPKYGDHAETWESDETYEIQVEVVDDFDIPWTEDLDENESSNQVVIPKLSHVGTAGKNPVQVAEVQTLSQQEHSLNSSAETQITYVSMDADNNVECHGFLPTFPLPIPYDRHDYSTLQELCAVQFSGGKRFVPLP